MEPTFLFVMFMYISPGFTSDFRAKRRFLAIVRKKFQIFRIEYNLSEETKVLGKENKSKKNKTISSEMNRRHSMSPTAENLYMK